MSTATSAALYQEQVRQTTSRETIDRCLEDLAEAKGRWRETSLARRIEPATGIYQAGASCPARHSRGPGVRGSRRAGRAKYACLSKGNFNK